MLGLSFEVEWNILILPETKQKSSRHFFILEVNFNWNSKWVYQLWKPYLTHIVRARITSIHIHKKTVSLTSHHYIVSDHNIYYRTQSLYLHNACLRSIYKTNTSSHRKCKPLSGVQVEQTITKENPSTRGKKCQLACSRAGIQPS